MLNKSHNKLLMKLGNKILSNSVQIQFTIKEEIDNLE
jgi:hypothetical protein